MTPQHRITGSQRPKSLLCSRLSGWLSALFPQSLARSLSALGFALLTTLLSGGAQAAYSGLVVFGDSLSDTGNLYTQSGGFYPQSPYANGRFSNGPVYLEVLAEQLGLSSMNSLSGGGNYAYGGATVLPGGLVPSLAEQYNTYITAMSGAADPGALYVVYGGANDLFNSSTATTAVAAANELVSIVSDLIAAGAGNILVPNLSDLGRTPALAGNAGATALSVLFNSTLSAGLAGLGGATIVQLDVFSLVEDTVAHPALYGFSNVTDACYTGGYTGGGSVCADPDSYLYWDGVHPTAAAHHNLSDFAYAALSPVPVPAAYWLFGSALLILASGRRGCDRGAAVTAR